MISEVIHAAKTFMANEFNLEASVVAVERMGDGWVASVEAIMVDPYMRRLAKKDLVATYELKLNGDYQVLSFERKAMRERGSVAP